MRLTRILLSGRKRRPGAARGNKKAGKHQEPHVILENERKAYVENLLLESTNEMWLTRPYLNRRQEKCLTTSFKQTTKGNPVKPIDTKTEYEFNSMKYRINVAPDVSFEERWSFAKTGKQWKREDENIHKKRELEVFARAVLPKRFPDFLPHATDKWDEWNNIEGFGLKEKSDTTVVKDLIPEE